MDSGTSIKETFRLHCSFGALFCVMVTVRGLWGAVVGCLFGGLQHHARVAFILAGGGESQRLLRVQVSTA